MVVASTEYLAVDYNLPSYKTFGTYSSEIGEEAKRRPALEKSGSDGCIIPYYSALFGLLGGLLGGLFQFGVVWQSGWLAMRLGWRDGQWPALPAWMARWHDASERVKGCVCFDAAKRVSTSAVRCAFVVFGKTFFSRFPTTLFALQAFCCLR